VRTLQSFRTMFFLIAAAWLFVERGHAAEINCEDTYPGNAPYEDERWPLGSRPSVGTCGTAFIVGEIQKGDFEKVRSLLAKNHPFLGTFLIRSSGGDAVEAMRIGTLFRKYLITAGGPTGNAKIGFVGPLLSRPNERCSQFHLDCGCASACALIWLGAVHRSGTVGLHRPRIEDQAFRSLPADDASKVYRTVLASIMAYLREMDTPDRLIEAMAATASTDIVWVGADLELARPPSIAEWMDATCQPLTSDERRMEKTLGEKMNALAKANSKLPDNEHAMLKRIFDKEAAHDNCETILLDSNREKLPRP
jgi:hypothetical protein